MTDPAAPVPAAHSPAEAQPRRADEHEIRKPDIQMMLQDLAQSNQTIFRERRDFERRLADERERSRWEQDRIRTELGEKLRQGERENDVLVRALGRLQAENERLREELAVARAFRANGTSGSASPPAEPPAPQATTGPVHVPVHPKGAVAPMPGTPKLSVFPVAPQLGGAPVPVADRPTAPPPA